MLLVAQLAGYSWLLLRCLAGLDIRRMELLRIRLTFQMRLSLSDSPQRLRPRASCSQAQKLVEVGHIGNPSRGLYRPLAY